ncbi:MAG: TonB family protein [Halieaceae bacterium]
MQAEYDVSGGMPTATGVSIAMHIIFALLISLSVASSVDTYKSKAVTVVLTPSKQAPTDASHLASQNQIASMGEIQSPLSEPSATTQLAIMQALAANNTDPGDLAAEVQKLKNELNQIQETKAQSTRLGSVAARRALDASYLQRWVNRVQKFGNAALANVGSARGDVRLLVVVDKLGILLDVTVLESSGFPHLDRAAIKTVQDAAPYPAFPPALSAQVDKLEIVRTWQFRP